MTRNIEDDPYTCPVGKLEAVWGARNYHYVSQCVAEIDGLRCGGDRIDHCFDTFTVIHSLRCKVDRALHHEHVHAEPHKHRFAGNNGVCNVCNVSAEAIIETLEDGEGKEK